MSYKLSKKSKIYRLLSLLLVSSITVIPTSANAQEKACVISDTGKKVCGKLVRDNDGDQPNTPSQSIATLNYPNSMVVNVQLLKCSRKVSTVNCKFSVIMTDPGRDYSSSYFYSAYGTRVSQATDNKGEDYIAEKITIGKSESRQFLFTSVVKDQPVSVTISFKIPAEINTIKTLSFLTGNYYHQSAARFSNINISR